MYQVAYVNNEKYFDVEFLDSREELDSFLCVLYKEQVCSIAKDYINVDMDGFTFKEGSWEYIIVPYEGVLRKEEVVKLEDGLLVRKGTENNYKKCPFCGKYHKKEDTVIVHENTDADVYICDSCFNELKSKNEIHRCSCCGHWYFKETEFVEIDNIIVCPTCANNAKPCEICGELHLEINMHIDIDGRLVCRECDYWDGGCYIDSYEHTRDLDPCYTGTETDRERDMLLGIELEIGSGYERDEMLAKYCIDQMNGYLICKDDGSINGEGFEMVTYPFSYKYHEKMMPKWEKILEKCDYRGFESGSRANTGMHVHINRPWFGETHDEQQENIDKLLYIFEAFWDNILKFSKRTNAKAQDWAARYMNIPRDEKLNKKKIKESSKGAGRYRAVNLCNTATVEIRIFNGTLDSEQFFANVQLVKRLMDIVTTMDETQLDELTWNEIINGDDKYGYLIDVGNRCIGKNADKKLKEYFEIEGGAYLDAWKRLPVGTKVHVSVSRGTYYSIGLTNEMFTHNGEWFEITEDTEFRANYGGSYSFNGYAYTYNMFDDYRLPEGTKLTLKDLTYMGTRDWNINDRMGSHSLEVREVSDHTDRGIKLKRLKDYYKPYMFKELEYIERYIVRA